MTSTNGALVHTKEQYDLFAGAEKFPTMVVLSMCMPCLQAKCPSCPYSPWNSGIRLQYADRPYMLRRHWEAVARECGQHKAWFRVTGGGEPFEHPDGMAHVLNSARRQGARTWVNTHGNLVTADVAWALLSYGHDLTEFSVDAADSKTYGVVRKGLSWKLLLHNIETYLRLRETLCPHATPNRPRVVVSIIKQDKLWAPSEQGRGHRDLPPEQRLAEVEKWWRDFGVDHVILRKFLVWGPQTRIDGRHALDPAPYLDAATPCPFPFDRVHIDVRGQINLCNYDITSQTDFGHLDRGDTIEGVWRGLKFEAIRAAHLGGKVDGKSAPLCHTCPDHLNRSWTHNYQKVDRLAGAAAMAAVGDPGLVTLGRK